MSNISELRPAADHTRAARAAYVHDSLKAERWSVRAAALAIGITNSVLATRMNGTTAFLADELESIARLLKVDPVQFYAGYLAAGDPETPEVRPMD
ncbi:helix-turn-helix domain-containing protein [Microbacterium luteum]|uniref:helix-turn-helix domain-containing protein n=1 Tax=Microbacterium luteum TaxID=2782167 RepID=UPI001888C55C|nr:helix-turn-helix transcriptional regulator [Microbacterium luteum]